jgi:hypothetical protein
LDNTLIEVGSTVFNPEIGFADVAVSFDHLVDRIVVGVESNYGNTYTCLYNIAVYGQEHL